MRFYAAYLALNSVVRVQQANLGVIFRPRNYTLHIGRYLVPSTAVYFLPTPYAVNYPHILNVSYELISGNVDNTFGFLFRNSTVRLLVQYGALQCRASRHRGLPCCGGGDVFLQNFLLGTIAPIRSRFTQSQYLLVFRSCDSVGGCSLFPLTVVIHDTEVWLPGATTVCYHNHVRL